MPALAALGQFHEQLVGEHDGGRQQLRRLVRREAEHDAPVSYTHLPGKRMAG